MFIATDDLLINTEQIINAYYTPEKQATDLDDFGVDENGILPSTLKIYFPTSASELDSGNPCVELMGEAADTVWNLLRSSHCNNVLRMPSRKAIDYAAREGKRAQARQAKAGSANSDDLPF